MDEDLALHTLRSGDGGQDKRPRRRMSEWSAEVELLTTVVDRLAELIQATLAVNGAKPPAVQPAPRPENVMDRIRASERSRRHRALVARVLPQHNHEPGGTQPPP